MASFSKGLASLRCHSFGMARAPCLPANMAASAYFQTATTTRLLSSSGCRFFSAAPLRAARPRVKSAKVKAKANAKPAPTAPTAAAPRSRPAAAAVPAPPARRPAAAPSSAAAAAAVAAAVRTFADQLGRRGAPTLLYEAPSHFWFRASCLLSGTFCLGYTVTNYWQVFLHPPPDLMWWVPHAFGLICIVMGGLGAYFIIGGAHIVRAIHAVPPARVAAVAGPGPAAKAAAAGIAAPVFLELQVTSIVPFMPLRRLYVPPASVALPLRLAGCGLAGDRLGDAAATPSTAAAATATHATASGYDRVMARRAEEERRKQEREYEMNHLMTAPFRHAAQGARTALGGVVRAFSRDGFLPIEVEGRRYKLDVTGGWALEHGRALDRLITIKEGQM